MVAMALGLFQITEHNLVPHHEEADKLAKARAKMFVVHEVGQH